VPQSEAYLRKLINGDIFRPLEFVKKSPEEQAKITLNMLEIPWNMDSIKTWFGEIPTVNYEAHILVVLKQIEDFYYKQREAINREIKVLEAQVKGIKDELPAKYDGEYWKTQKVQDYYDQHVRNE
jgi:exonuclease SbcC